MIPLAHIAGLPIEETLAMPRLPLDIAVEIETVVAVDASA